MPRSLILTLLVTAAISVFAERHASAAGTSVPSIDELLNQMRGSTQPAVIAPLGQQLADRRPDTQRELALLLEAGRDKAFIPYVQLCLSKTSNPALGSALYDSFKSLMSRVSAIPPERLEKESREEIGESPEVLTLSAVITALGNVKYKEAIPDLREILTKGKAFQGYISAEASEALGQMGDEQSLDAIIDQSLQGKPVTLSGYRANGIHKIVERMEQIQATYKARPHVPNDPRGEEMITLREKLAHMGKKDAKVKEALRALLPHPILNVQIGAAHALLWSIGPNDKDITLEMLHHKVDLVRMTGLRSLSLSKTWDKSFLPIIIEMIEHDPAFSVRESAVAELNELPSSGVSRADLQSAVPVLEALVKDKSKKLQGMAFESLRSLTGRFYPYEGMPAEEQRQMEMGPAYQPEPGEHVSKEKKP